MDPTNLFGRGLDARFNRLSEALRTIEDRFRFDLGLARPTALYKELRHRVGALRRTVEDAVGPLSRWRDVGSDPGAPAVGAQDPPKPWANADDLVAGNLARARESARSLEETLRLALPGLATIAEHIRYDIYAAETAASGLLRRHRRLQEVRLYVLLTTDLASKPVLEAARAAIRGGAQMIQLREKNMRGQSLLRLARDLRELTAELGALLIVNDSVDIAALCGADGVHGGQDDLKPKEARRILGPDAIVGISTHSAEQAEKAEEDGGDYIGIGPIYATETKKHRKAVGLDFIGLAGEVTSIPGFVIGSVNRETLAAVLARGAKRVAICTGIISAPDIEGSARWFRERVDQAWETA